MYVVGRLGQTILTLLLLSVIVFLLARVLGDPLLFMLPFDSLPADVDRVRLMLGFDRPLIVQYGEFVSQLLQGNLGVSLRQRVPVTELIFQRWLASVVLVGTGLAWALALSIVLGVLAALYRGGPIDATVRTIAIVGQSAPAFWIGIVLVQVFSVRLELLPSGGEGGLAHLILPAFTIGLLGLAGMTRLLRSSMLDVLDAEYVKKARIMGVPERTVIWKHALRNALIPVLTIAGEYFGILISAAVVVETVFAWPGMGSLAYEAVFTRDYPLIQAVVLVMAGFILAVNLAVDVLYAYIDPRIRYGNAE
jgi:peptide/nickel transport system permease protein